MATPPTRVVGVTPAVGWNSNVSPKTSPTFDVVNGDLIVLLAFTENGDSTLATPTWTGTGTWALQQSIVVTNYCTAYLYTCPVTATTTGRTITMTQAGNGVNTWSFYASVWRNHGGLGVTGKTNVASGAPALTLATSANSAVVCGNSDWTATSPTGHTWRTVNGVAMVETSQGGNSGVSYETYTGYSPNTGAAGNTIVGLLTPSTQKYSIVGAEVLGTASTTKQGSAAGTVTFTGASAGQRTPKGSGAGTVGFTAATVGKRSPVATGAGTLHYTGTATGTRPAKGAAAGAVSFTAATTGTRTPKGTAPGQLHFTAAAAGTRAPKGTAAGAVGFTGTAVGSSPHKGSTAGGVAFTGSAAGVAPVVGGKNGTSAGTVHYTGSATGQRQPVGAAAGTVRYTATAAGTAPVVGMHQGAAAGTVRYAGTATGVTARAGHAAGLLSFTGHAVGTVSRTGAAAGSHAYTAAATGTNRNAADVTVTASLPGRAWAGTLTNQPRASTLTPRPWAATSTTQTRTAALDTQGWGARLE